MDADPKISPHPTPWRARVHRIIFGTDTPAGMTFDVALLVAILVSVAVVSLETVKSIAKDYGDLLVLAEWCFTVLFTIEYALRLLCVRRPMRYARSFFGVIDLLSFLPTYLMPLAPGAQSVVVLRMMRLLRVFRILALPRFFIEAEWLGKAFWEARARIVVFLVTVLIAVTITGTVMYHVEYHYRVEETQEKSQFTSIPQSMYWAVVTMTTVGYGDVVPRTAVGKILSAVLILLGYSLIIVPTGFVSAELIRSGTRTPAHRECPSCSARGHNEGARFCHQCAAELPPRA
jgi:voltage-gated potassium channel